MYSSTTSDKTTAQLHQVGLAFPGHACVDVVDGDRVLANEVGSRIWSAATGTISLSGLLGPKVDCAARR